VLYKRCMSLGYTGVTRKEYDEKRKE